MMPGKWYDRQRERFMITTDIEYKMAREETELLGQRLESLMQPDANASRPLTMAGIRKLIARLREEIAVFEATRT